jgi:hypothetical protein
MNSDLTSLLEVMAYLTLGTLAIALAAGWLLKRFGPRK